MTYSIKIKRPNGETIHELLFVCSNCLAKTFCFLPAIGHLVMPKFFSAKYMFAMVTTKGHRHLHIKLRPLITWVSDIMRQTLKCIQNKQIFSILYHINCESKYLLE